MSEGYQIDADEDDDDIVGYTTHKPGLESRLIHKLVELQDQLIGHAYGGSKLSDNDVIRYSAMVEVLKAVLQ